MEISGFPEDQNIFGRATRDLQTAIQLVRFKLAELCSGLVNVCISILVPPMILPELTGPTQAIVGAIAVAGGALAMIGALFCGYLVLAPFRQRDEARATLSQINTVPTIEVKEAVEQLRKRTVALEGKKGVKDMASIFQELHEFLVAENDSPSEVIRRHLGSRIGVSSKEAPVVLTYLQNVGVVRNETRRSIERWDTNPPPPRILPSPPEPMFYIPQWHSEPVDKTVVVITSLGIAVLRDLAKGQ